MKRCAVFSGFCLLILFVSMPSWSQQVTAPTDAMKEQVRGVIDNSATVTNDVQDVLDSVMERVNSPQWKADQARLKRKVQILTGVATSTEQDDDTAFVDNEDRLILFVSSSMPLQTLRHYAHDLEKVNGLMVLRGMIGGMGRMGPTLSFISRVLRIDPLCEGGNCATRTTHIVIDPILFRENAIELVPAAMFVENMPLEPYCERFDEQSIPPKARYAVYGDASILHMASELHRLSNNPALKRMVSVMEKL